ncbi:hypothetical protein Tco_0382083 [Tanacetum coccineum]
MGSLLLQLPSGSYWNISTNVIEEVFGVFGVVGVATALALKRVPNMKFAVRKIIIRTLKMLFWGIILQGWYSHAPDELVYGVDMKIIRWCGILQFRPTVLQPGHFSISKLIDGNDIDGVSKSFTVECGMRGHLEPACNTVGYVDRETGDLRPDAPTWCHAPLEPEGLLSSISAILYCVIGIHYGHVLIYFKGHVERLKQWVSMALGLLVIAIVLHFSDVNLIIVSQNLKGYLTPEDLDFRIAVHYSIPSTASVLAFDPIQRVLAIGTLSQDHKSTIAKGYGSSRHRSSPEDEDRSDIDRHRSSHETRDKDKDG